MAAYHILAIILIIISMIYLKLRSNYRYWERKGVNGPTPMFIIGNFKDVLLRKHSITSFVSKTYNEYPNDPIVGIYVGLSPSLIIRDPELIKLVLVKDFDTFIDRGFRVTDEPLMRNLFSEDGDSWRILRQRLSPIFTSGKLKQMMPLLNNCAEDFKKYQNKIIEGNESLEVRSVCDMYFLKCITSCAFGIEIDPFSDDGQAFIDTANKMFGSNFRIILASVINNIIPGLPVLLKFKTAHKDVTDFMFRFVTEIIAQREGQPKARGDFMDLLIEMKEQGKLTQVKGNGIAEIEITDEIMVAQAATFYGAGFETSSGAMSFLLYELALNQDIQDRCYDEIKRVMQKYNEKLTLESLSELEYVAMALDEAMRKHPIGSMLIRQCVKNYKLPGTDLIIEKGMKIKIPNFAIQKDPQYFPNPEKFDPERFSPENKKAIHGYTFLPFGDGPRNCIGKIILLCFIY